MAATLREARAGDLAGILALYGELRPHDPVLPEATAQAKLAEIIGRPDVHLFVCDAGGVLAATCMLAIIPNLASGARPFGVIEHVVTLAARRRSGYARQVMQHALAHAWSRGCCKVMLLSGEQRPEAHRLYEALGFRGDIERGFVVKPVSGGKLP
jgi:GNAT superfamily N-acetyltransferase